MESRHRSRSRGKTRKKTYQAREGITLKWVNDNLCEGELNGAAFTGIFSGNILRIIKNESGAIMASLEEMEEKSLNSQMGTLDVSWKGKWGEVLMVGVEVDGSVTLFGIR